MEIIFLIVGVLLAVGMSGVVATGAAILGGAALAGGIGSFLSSSDKPDIPEVPDINIQGSQRQAIRGNIRALGQATKLGKKVDRFNRKQFEQTIKETFPEFSDTAKQISENIAAQARGEIPTDVSEAVQRSAAAQAVAGGFAGSGLQRNLTARDLGTTSLNLTNQALNSASRWLQTVRAAGPQQFDVTSAFVSPSQQIQADLQQQQLQFQRNLLEAGVEAQPSKTERAIGGALQGLGGAGMTVGGSMLGQAFGASQVGGSSLQQGGFGPGLSAGQQFQNPIGPVA